MAETNQNRDAALAAERRLGVRFNDTPPQEAIDMPTLYWRPDEGADFEPLQEANSEAELASAVDQLLAEAPEGTRITPRAAEGRLYLDITGDGE